MSQAILSKAVDILNKKGGSWQPCNIPDKTVNKSFGKWQMIVNGRSKTIKVKPEQGGEVNIKPYTMMIFYNGWLFGILDPNHEVILHSDEVNADLFLRELRQHPEARRTSE